MNERVKELIERLSAEHGVAAAGVQIVNCGVAIAHMHGILERSLRSFPDMLKLCKKS